MKRGLFKIFQSSIFFSVLQLCVWQYFWTSHSYIQNELKLLLSKIWPKFFFEKQMFSGQVKQTSINSFLEESLNIGETPIVVTPVTCYFLIYFTLSKLFYHRNFFEQDLLLSFFLIYFCIKTHNKTDNCIKIHKGSYLEISRKLEQNIFWFNVFRRIPTVLLQCEKIMWISLVHIHLQYSRLF